MSRLSRICVFLLWAGCAGLLRSQQAKTAETAESEIVIQNVTVISPERKAPLPHATVVIRDGKIAAIHTGAEARLNAERDAASLNAADANEDGLDAGGPKTVAAKATVIDGGGRFLVPGLIDSHTHPGSMGPLDDEAIKKHPDLLESYRRQLVRSYLAFGFTTLIDLDLHPGTQAWFDGGPDHPDLYHCGRGVRIAGGYMELEPPQDAAQAVRDNVVYEPGQASRWAGNVDAKELTPARAVERVVEAGGICVKTFIEPGFGGAAHWPVPEPATLNALRAEAARHDLTFVVHANAVESWQKALDAHADVIAHGLWHWPGDQLGTTPPAEAVAVVRRAAGAGVWVQPTLQAVYGDESIFDRSLLADPRLGQALPRDVIQYLHSDEGRAAAKAMADEYREAIAKLLGTKAEPADVMAVAAKRAMATLKLMLQSGVKLLFGTDTPSNEGIGNPPGLNGRLELQRWFEAGVPLDRILRAATLDNARAFHLEREIGTVGAGKRANLLLLRGNPLKSIGAYDAIDMVFVDGRAIERESLVAK